jgi:hypothetical protein
MEATVMAGCEEWLEQTQAKVFSVASENFGHAKLVTNVPIGSRTISVESGTLRLKVVLYCPDKVAVYEPEAVVIARDGSELTDDIILQLLNVGFRKRV